MVSRFTGSPLSSSRHFHSITEPLSLLGVRQGLVSAGWHSADPHWRLGSTSNFRHRGQRGELRRQRWRVFGADCPSSGHSSWMIPRLTAKATAAVRPRTPSLEKMLLTWALIVPSVTFRQVSRPLLPAGRLFPPRPSEWTPAPPHGPRP